MRIAIVLETALGPSVPYADHPLTPRLLARLFNKNAGRKVYGSFGSGPHRAVLQLLNDEGVVLAHGEEIHEAIRRARHSGMLWREVASDLKSTYDRPLF